MEDKFFSTVDHEPLEPPEDPIADMSEEDKKTMVSVLASCLSTRQRQVYFLHHGVTERRMKHKLIATKLGLTEAEVDEIYYSAHERIADLIENLSDLQDENKKPSLRPLHIWAAN